MRKYKSNAEMALKARAWADRHGHRLRRRVWGPIALEVRLVSLLFPFPSPLPFPRSI